MERTQDGVRRSGTAGAEQLRAGRGDSTVEAAAGAAARGKAGKRVRAASRKHFSRRGWEFASAGTVRSAQAGRVSRGGAGFGRNCAVLRLDWRSLDGRARRWNGEGGANDA